MPIHSVGEAAPETLVVTENSTVQVEAEATHIPEYIEVDIEGAPAGTQIHASDLVLPDGTTLVVDPETLVINITQAQSAEEVEAELAEAEAEAGIVHDPATRSRGGRGRRGRGRRARARRRRGRVRGRRRGVILERFRRREQRRSLPTTSPRPVNDVWLVVGLGNPGPAYAGHRHNVGYLVVDVLAERMGSALRAHKSGRAEVVEGRLGADGHRRPARRARPGPLLHERVRRAVYTLARFYKVPPERIIAVHDELDIPFGALRAKLGGGDNGHNGLRSMRSSLGTGDFYRVRVGIGRPPGRQDPADFVLSELLRGRAQGAADQVVEAAERSSP